MSRIIESCNLCTHLTEIRGSQEHLFCIYTQRIVPHTKPIPDFCPLPSLDDKLREAWDAGYAEGKEPCILNKQQAYDEWRKQNG